MDVIILVVTEHRFGFELLRCLTILIWGRRFVEIFNTRGIYGIYWLLQQQLLSQIICLQ